MHLLERIHHRWINDQDLQELNEAQCRAVVEVLALAVYADGNADPIELSTYEDLVFTLPFPWEGFDTLEDYARECKERVAELDEEDFEARIYSVGELIPDEVGPQVFAMVSAILVIDEILDDAEGEILTMFCEALEVDDHEARMIFDELVEDLGLVEIAPENELIEEF